MSSGGRKKREKSSCLQEERRRESKVAILRLRENRKFRERVLMREKRKREK